MALLTRLESTESNLDSHFEGKLQEFAAEGLITEVIDTLKSGKEATCFLCASDPSLTGAERVVAKIYRPSRLIGGRNMSAYHEGLVILDQRTARAFKKHGQKAIEGIWSNAEYDQLNRLYDAGVDCPEPIAATDDAILMQFIGEGDTPAPMLNDVRLTPDEAYPKFCQMMDNIERMMRYDAIHGDLSPYNVLYTEERLVIIDLPQCVDPRMNPNARQMLQRDIENVCRYWARFGVERRAFDLADRLWDRWWHGKL
ncbi:MAG: serine protein kinase RIO [Candidatus Poribacteria bacterium]|nr:serine protein kinase RIO [Candidatus Poribacteria bacterium]